MKESGSSLLHASQYDVFLDQLVNPGTAQYNIGGFIKLRGELNKKKFEEAVNSAAGVFDAFKMRFDLKAGETVFKVKKGYNKLPLKHLDFSILENGEGEAEKWMKEQFNIPFKVDSKEELFNHYLLKISEKEFWFYGKYHHLITDGYGFIVFVNYVARKYKQLVSGIIESFSFPSYLKEVNLSQEYLGSFKYLEDKDYWNSKISEVPLPLISKYSYRNPTLTKSQTFVLRLTSVQKENLEKLQRNSQAGLQQLTIAALLAYYGKITGQGEMVFGIPVHRRGAKYLRNVVGMFSGIIPFKGFYEPQMGVGDLLNQIKREQLKDYRHHNYPIGDLSRDLKINPLEGYIYQISVNYEPLGFDLDFGEQIESSITRLANEDDRVPLQINWRDYGNNQALELHINFMNDYFTQNEIEILVQRLFSILDQFSAKQHTRLGDLKIISSEEEFKLLQRFNNTQTDYPKDKTIVDLFGTQASKSPNQTAVVYQNEQLTYQQLNERSNRLAHYLKAKGVTTETLVPICVERSIEMIVGILGILKSGAAYVPIDPEYPQDRIDYMLEDTGAKLVLTDTASKQKLRSKNIELVDIAKDIPTGKQFNNLTLNNLTSNNLAYVIYTSGSTGRPKGVMIEHGNVNAFIHWCYKEFEPKHFEMAYAVTSMCFDLSVFEMFYPLTIGKPVRILENALHIEKYLTTDRKVLLNTVPSVVEGMLREGTDLSHVTMMNMAGEPISNYVQQHVDTQTTEVRNLYGPSEDTTYSTVFRLEKDRPVTIGKPIHNTKIRILNKDLDLLPIGVSGEICISGDGVARGYLNRPELTQEKFIEDPFDKTHRLYRTGDLGRWLEDGNIEYLGRIDDQVKIRGYRIELGEIEATIQQSGMTKQSVVVAKPDKEGNKRLVGYIVAEKQYSREGLMGFLRRRLPEYMIPTFLIELEELPLTTNGKLDKNALPEPESLVEVTHFVAPQTPTQIVLVEIWERILGLERLGIHDNFFKLGGNSISALRIVSAIRRDLKTEIEVHEMFATATLKDLAATIDGKNFKTQIVAVTKQIRPNHIPLSSSQERLWFIDKLEGSLPYHIPIVLNLQGEINEKALEYAFATVVDRHEVLRTVFEDPDGRAFQNVLKPDHWKMNFINAIDWSEDKINATITKDVETPFDLTTDYMLRATLIKVGNNTNILVITLHHIATDAWSLEILIEEVNTLYGSKISNRVANLKPLNIQYIDYALWQRDYLQGESYESKINYWVSKLQNTSKLELPYDFIRPLKRSYKGETLHFNFDNKLSRNILQYSQNKGITPFMTLLAGLNVLLKLYSGQDDICIGTSIANRNALETEKLIGFFVNTLALRNHVNHEETFEQLLEKVKNTTSEAYDNCDVPFDKVVDSVVTERDPLQSPLFQVMLVYTYTPETSAIKLGDLEISRVDFDLNISKFDFTIFVNETDTSLDAKIEYSTELFKESTIRGMLSSYRRILEQILQKQDLPLSSLELIEDQQKTLLLEQGSSSLSNDPKQTVLEMLQEQTLQHPDRIALVSEGESLSYAELDKRSNQIAGALIAKGVRPGSAVLLYLEQAIDRIAGIVGILKSGGCYVPIDTDFPASRIEYILSDTGAGHILSTGSLIKTLEPTTAAFIDIEKLTEEPYNYPKVAIPSQSPAYVIYTSGSTGKPKGVVVSHGNLTDYVHGLDDRIQISQCTSYALVSSIATDLGNTVLYGSLVYGGTLHLFSKEAVRSAEYLQDYFKHTAIDCLKIVPSHWKALSEQRPLLPKKLLIFGGESLPGQTLTMINQTQSSCRVINHYGPTETTIGKLLHEADKNRTYGTSVPIGTPFGNTRVYVLSPWKQLCPVGVPGELYIAGAGLSQGYWNNEQLTQEKFIANPIEPSPARLYATGDRVKYLEDGNIEYLGRIDDQVKIRGYRVEPMEIERMLDKSGLLQMAAIEVKQDSNGNKYLVAYVVAGTNYSKEKLGNYLKQNLPEYMIPGQTVEMESFPMLPNGKIDRIALPEPLKTDSANGLYVAPRNESELILTTIWQELLDLEKVGIHDNFFELGGDSIITIQLVSRARRAGLELQVGDVFTYQTIARLSSLLEQRSSAPILSGEQSVLSGSSGMLPVQKWFFGKNPKSFAHFNQSLIFKLSKNITEKDLKGAVDQLLSQHDALRFKYFQDQSGNWQQVYNADFTSGIVVEDLTEFLVSDLAIEISRRASIHQKSLDIERGDLVRFIWMLTPNDEKSNRLLIIIHHLAVDGVSWRILLEDLDLLLTGYKNAGSTNLGSKTSSYRQWYVALKRYSNSQRLLNQRSYWLNAAKSYSPFKTDIIYPGETYARDFKNFIVHLNSEKTHALVHHVPRVYHTEINDILICALAATLKQWSGYEKLTIGMEGHGREDIEDDIDTSRTVGWFTMRYPLVVDLKNTNSESDLIKSVKEQIRKVPDKGLGYEVLKYFLNETSFQNNHGWDIIFNYLGQIDNSIHESQWLLISDDSVGEMVSGDFPVNEKISVNASIHSGKLSLNWGYSTVHYNAATIETLAQIFFNYLESLIEHCLNQSKTGNIYTPSDFRLGDEVEFKELDHFFENRKKEGVSINQIESLYRLSGLQYGMLFHGLYDSKAASYMRQFICDISNVNIAYFQKSWEYLLERHTILRSGIFNDSFSIPVQAVFKKVRMPVSILDFSSMGKNEQLAAIQQYQESDLLNAFDFQKAPLMRLTLIRTNDLTYRMVWTWHHILFDGWSMPIMIEELLKNYEILVSNERVKNVNEDRFEDYIRYVEHIDRYKEKNYWSNYFKGYENNSLLPFINSSLERTKGSGVYETLSIVIDKVKVFQIQEFSQIHRLTVNTIMQGVWSFLLHRFTGRNDVVFGVTISGRPEDLPGVENRVGMYINTIPLRSVLNENRSVNEWLDDIQKEQRESAKFQYTSITDIKEWADIKGDMFDSILVFENYPVSKVISEKQWSIKVDGVKILEKTNYPLSISVFNGEELEISFGYNSSLIKSGMVKLIAEQFEHILSEIVKHAYGRLSEISNLGKKHLQLLEQFNSNKVEYPTDVTIVELIEKQVKLTPDAVAVVYDDQSLTYQQLNERSNQVAHYLKAKGVTTETLVPICIERSIEMIVGILGILKSGAAYVPIDPEYPQDRIDYMLEDTGAKLVLTDTASKQKLRSKNIELVDIAKDIPTGKQFNNLTLNNLTSNNLAYVIYTSGSTGKPKGVMNQHDGLVNRLLWAQDQYGLTSKDTVLQKTTFSFDVSVWELLWPLMAGAKLVFAKPEGHKDAEYLKEVIDQHNITLMHFVPSMLEVFLTTLNPGDCSSLTKVLCSGEALGSSQVKEFREKLPSSRLHNLYGPTEAAIDVTYWSDSPDQNVPTLIPIGKPVANTSIHILDGNGRVTPIGIAGEVHIGGIQVARGYLNRPELTQEKFIEDPFDKTHRLYRTGDLGRWLEDGNIEYLGRIDDQVKIRGYRIELGEIEATIQQSGMTKQSVVLAKQDTTGQKYLTGYVIPQQTYSKEQLQTYLQTKLPGYMVPDVWVTLETIPLTPNGKIDKKSLPDPDQSHRQGEYVAPQNQTQQTLAEIWQELLKIERVGIKDNFFALGGHSLLAMRLISAIRKELSQEIGVKELFTYPSIEELSRCLQEQNTTELLPPITPAPRLEHIPLSFSQERLWFIDKLEGSRHYHIPSVLRLKGNVNTKALEGSLRQIIKRHESLRTTIHQIEDQPYQKINPSEGWIMGKHDLTDRKDTEHDLVLSLINAPFNLEKDYMLRADLIQSSKQEYTLVVTLHHIASDGWSTSVMVREVVELYNAGIQKREPSLKPLAIQYADYSIWQRQYLTQDLLAKKLDYWKDKLEGTMSLELPTDKVRPALQSTNGQSIGFSIDKTTTDLLEKLSQNKGATMFMTTLAAFKVLLYRYSSQQDICVGTPVAGRTHKETEDLIGYFINTLALRTVLQADQSFDQILDQIRTTTLEAYAHQDVPFEKVIETVVKQRDLSRSPLFQVMFVYQNTPEVPQLKLGDVELGTRSTPNTKVKFELTLNLSQTSTGLRGSIQYCTDIYEQSTIQRLIGHYKQLLESVVETPHTSIGVLEILNPQEKEQLLQRFNNTQTDYPKDKTIVELFQTQASKTPNQTAVVYQNEQLTYQQLNERSNQVAHYLKAKGVTTETLVPICVERSIEMIVGIFGILKSGAAYVPIDPEYPQDRIDYMLEDTGAKLVLTDTASKQKLRSKNIELVDIAKDIPTGKQFNNLTLNNLTSNNLAYVIYTSGSTGRPKGVMIEHGNVNAFIHWCYKEFEPKHFEMAYAVTSMCFDLSVFEMFYPLTIGKPVRILENALHIEKYLTTDRKVLLNTVPSVVEGMLREGTDLSHVTMMNMAGEPISNYVQQHVDTQTTEVRNLYGPSEDTTYSTVFRLEKDRPVTIGKPIHNTQIRILNKDLDLLPIGVSGEICISGDGVARGYLNRPELTQEKFIEDPFNPQSKLYRTGDLGRWLEDGNIEYLGRIDDQVKIRGYRIELGEIEATIQQSGMTKQSVVLAKQDTTGQKYLTGYVIPQQTYSKEQLQTYLQTKLPGYMVPDVWVTLETIPLTPNGKIDKKSLPDPDQSHRQGEYVAPQNQIQQTLAEIWQDLLKIERVGIKDNFFALGGHSLLAMRLISAIRKELSQEIGVKELFTYPSIEELSRCLQEQNTTELLPPITPAPRPEHIPLSFSQERLWFIDKLEGSRHYHIPSVLRLKGNVNTKALEGSLRQIIKRHESLRTTIHQIEDQPYQKINPSEGWRMGKHDLTDRKDTEHDLVLSLINAPFNLEKDYMLRADLIQSSKQEYTLVVTLHHIASDGWSTSVMVREVVELYNAGIQKREPSLKPLAIQYADYSIWQRQYLTQDLLAKKLDYWKDKLEGTMSLELPTDKVRPALQSTNGQSIGFSIDKRTTDQLEKLSHHRGATMFMTTLAAFKVLLYRYSSQQDICVGTPVAGRTHKETEDLIGYFINTLALRDQMDSEGTFSALMDQVKTTTLEAFSHQDVPFEKVVETVVKQRDLSRNPLFGVVFMYHNIPEVSQLKLEGLTMTPTEAHSGTSKFDITLSLRRNSRGIQGRVEYCTDLFDQSTILRMMDQFSYILDQVSTDPNKKLSQISLSTQAQTGSVVKKFATREYTYPKDRTIVSVFEQQVAKTPNAIAVVFNKEELTYQQLNERSNRLAHYLKAKGVTTETLVPICIERSIEMMVGILGILKSGAAYVPIDPEYPQDRIDYMLKDTGAKLVLTDTASKSKLKRKQIELVDIAKDIPTGKQFDNVTLNNLTINNLAYVIYTSGSTGTPKGVMVEHVNVVSLAVGGDFVKLDQDRVLLSTGSSSFDATTIEYWGMLLNGGKLVLCREDDLLNYETLKHEIQRHKVTLMWFTAGWFNKLVETDVGIFEPLQTLMVGGEKLSEWHINRLLQRYPTKKILNGYGPTENTTFSLTYDITEQQTKTIPIGRPLANRSAYILDKDQNPLPIGVPGELYVGGDGVSRGYLNNPELTREKFIRDPFTKHGRLYRTGDLGRWLEDGNIEYLGRIDDQVKIRGYRIELGEIEAMIQQSGLTKQSVVVASEDSKGTKRLVGYVVSTKSFSKQALETYLGSKLPEYMVPRLWVELEQLPLTSNGKIDKRALPQPEIGTQNSEAYVAPQNQTQQTLAQIWQDLLGVNEVGIEDNFFELGGDSILTIQVVSRARRAGLEMEPRDLFTHQNISKLSEAIRGKQATQSHGEQGTLEGYSGLLPIQQWYLSHTNGEVSHFNQSVLLKVDRMIGQSQLEAVVKHLVHYHDALRFKYQHGSEGWTQQYGLNPGELDSADLSKTSKEEYKQQLAELCQNTQQSLDITKGDIIRCVWIQTPPQQKHNRLLLVIHHLAVDGVSWRILLEDMEVILKAITQSEQVTLGTKSSSYRQWYEALEQYGQSSAQKQLAYWQTAHANYQPLSTDTDYRAEVLNSQTTSYQSVLNKEQTSKLLQEVSKVYHTEINDLLLSALATAVTQWQKTTKVNIGLEGHGREHLNDKIDLNRTVGWFTSLYPVHLDLEQLEDTSQRIKGVKEQLRAIPDKGLGYGVLKYIGKQASLQGEDPWDIVFNYLGQLDTAVSGSKWFKAASEPQGQMISPSHKVGEKLSVNGYIESGELKLTWGYSPLHYHTQSIEDLAKAYIEALNDIITHCLNQKDKVSLTPSDYGLVQEVGFKELDAFLDGPQNLRDRIEGMYRLSGLQQGMLFHELVNENSAAYTEQFKADLLNLDILRLKESFNQLTKNHEILRNGFYHDSFQIPIQCVFKQVEVPFILHDLSKLNKLQQGKELASFEAKDLLKPFDLKSPPLMRVNLFDLGKGRIRMLWTFHHILIDGWSLPVLMEEFLNIYEGLIQKSNYPIIQEDKFADYIKYIERSDTSSSETYWKKYLSGVEQPTLLPFINNNTDRNKGEGIYKIEKIELSLKDSLKIQEFALQSQITVNTLMQWVWSTLLHQYTGNSDVIFGAIVSGRPDALENIEKRVGMYINTLPLRNTIKENETVTESLKRLQLEQVESRNYQYTPLHEIQKWTGVQEDIFDSILTFENYPVNKTLARKNWTIQFENVDFYGQSNYTLTIIVKSDEKIAIDLIYNSSNIEEDYVKLISSHFKELLIKAPSNASVYTQELKVLPESERIQLIKLGYSRIPTSNWHSICDLFEKQVQLNPNAIALVMGSAKYTFNQLNSQANQLASFLKAKGVGSTSLVPLYCERSPEMIIGILGILKAEAAYVPIDIDLPIERVRYILKDIHAELILGTKSALAQFSDYECIDLSNKNLFSKYSNADFARGSQSDNPAYVIYTSGSTGQPKGVMVDHRNLLDYIEGLNHNISINACSSFALVSTIATDLGNTVIFASLLNGGNLHLFSKANVSDGAWMRNYFKENPIDCLKIVPSHWKALKDEELLLLPLKMLIFGGELLSTKDCQDILGTGASCKIINHYGPTETTIGKLLHQVIPGYNYGMSIPIGKPFSNTQVYVLNKQLDLCSIGVPGELYIGGEGVSKGYLNNKELTDSKFIQDPFNNQGRIYATGDLVKYNPDGNIEFLGRIDDQVKIRGYRVELNEIAAAIENIQGVNHAAVICLDSLGVGKRVIAYYTATQKLESDVVRSILNEKLPDYMLPSAIIHLEKIPLTANGKLDRKALPHPDLEERTGEKFVSPYSEEEKKMAGLWENILEVEKVGLQDDFFELGGHSLLAIRLVSAIRKAFKVEMPIGDIFDYPTIAQLIPRLHLNEYENIIPNIEKLPHPEHIPLSFGQERLWFIDKLDGSSSYHLTTVLRLNGNLDVEALNFALKSIVQRHEALRTIIYEINGIGYQKVKNEQEWTLSAERGSKYKDKKHLENTIAGFTKTPFDLSSDFLLRAKLLELSKNEFVLILVMHHLGSDAWSNSILVKEIHEFYVSFVKGKKPSLKSLPIQYSDYALWQRNILTSEVVESKLDFWKNKLNGVKELEIPRDFQPKKGRIGLGSKIDFNIDTNLKNSLNQISQNHSTSLFVVMQTVFKILLYRYTNQEDICIGTSVARREQEELYDLIGFFTNTIALRNQISKDLTFVDLMGDVHKVTMEAYKHQDIPFEKVVEVVVKKRNLGKSPIFQVMFVMNNTPLIPKINIPELEIIFEENLQESVKFEVTLFVRETEDGIKGSLHYSTELFSKDRMLRMIGHYKMLLNSVVKNPDLKIGLLQMLSKDEQNQLLADLIDND